MTELKNDERLEPLGKEMQIVVSDSHTFGTDAILLASFASIKRKDVACDMGTGCGIIPLIWCKGVTNEVFGLDIQPKAISQLEKSLEINDMVGRETGRFDLIPLLVEPEGIERACKIKFSFPFELHPAAVCGVYVTDKSGAVKCDWGIIAETGELYAETFGVKLQELDYKNNLYLAIFSQE